MNWKCKQRVRSQNCSKKSNESMLSRQWRKLKRTFFFPFFAKVRRRWSIAYHVKDSQDEKEVVKNAVNPLSPKGPNGDSIAKKTDNAHDENQQTFCHPLKIVHLLILFFSFCAVKERSLGLWMLVRQFGAPVIINSVVKTVGCQKNSLHTIALRYVSLRNDPFSRESLYIWILS